MSMRVNEDSLGSHICSIYRYLFEKMVVSRRFFEEGLRKGEKCIYIADKEAIKELEVELERRNGSYKKWLDSGQMMYLDNAETYLEDGLLCVSKVKQLMTEGVAQIRELRYVGLRVAGELPMVVGYPIEDKLIVEYENEIDKYLAKTPKIKALCHYYEERYDRQTLAVIINKHLDLVIYGKKYKNRLLKNGMKEDYFQLIDRLIEDDERPATRSEG